MKILNVLGGLGLGGTETYLLRLCRFMRRSENDDDLEMEIAFNAKYAALAADFDDLGIRLLPCKGNPSRSLTFLPNLLKRNHYDAVCSFSIPEFLSLRHAANQKIPKRIAFLRVRYRPGMLLQRSVLPGLPINTLWDRTVIEAERFFLPRYATHVLSNSQAALDELWPNGIRDKNIQTAVIRNGIELPELSPPFDATGIKKKLGIPKQMKVVGQVAAFRLQKNHRLSFSVAEEICRRRDDVFFAFFGEGTKEGIRELLPRNKFPDRIVAFGRRDDIFDILRILDVFFLPSFSEGQSNALLEAMTFGVPFLIGNCAENLEIVPKEFYRFALPPNDATAFITQIEEMLDRPWNEKQREIIQRHGRALCDSYENFTKFLNILKTV